MANIIGKIVMKILTIVVGIPVGKFVKRLVEQAWAAARPEHPPRRPAEPGVRWGDAVGWAALSAAGVVATDLLTRRGAESMWRAVMGTEPPPSKKRKAEHNLEQAQESLGAVR